MRRWGERFSGVLVYAVDASTDNDVFRAVPASVSVSSGGATTEGLSLPFSWGFLSLFPTLWLDLTEAFISGG